ncbi:MAG: hypothetical protein FWE79_03375, partial [Firmicutes bacterium]|nr:hypothetical protein [Bacillota bacterium]
MCWEIVSAIGSLLSGLGIIVAIVAYLLSKKKFEVDIDFKRKENAIQIAERYTSMINSITFITVLYQEFRKKTANINFGTAPVRKYIETHKVEQLLFNKKEYDQIYGKDKDIFSEILDIVDKDKTLFLEIYTMFHDDDAAVIKKL